MISILPSFCRSQKPTDGWAFWVITSLLILYWFTDLTFAQTTDGLQNQLSPNSQSQGSAVPLSGPTPALGPVIASPGLAIAECTVEGHAWKHWNFIALSTI